MKLKEVLFGVIIGALLTSGILVVAEETLSVTPNPFKITVNGEEKKINGYNINGSSYFKLRDIGEEVGFDVGFKEDTIMITRINNVVASSQTESKWMDDEFNSYISDGKIYYRWSYYETSGLLLNTHIHGMPTDNGHNMMLRRKLKDDSGSIKYEVLLENIEYIMVDGRVLISEDYFNEVILPIDKSLSE